MAEQDKSKSEETGVSRRRPAQIPKILDTKDPAVVQANIYSVYGSKVTAQFAADLLAFVEKARRGDYSD